MFEANIFDYSHIRSYWIVNPTGHNIKALSVYSIIATNDQIQSILTF